MLRRHGARGDGKGLTDQGSTVGHLASGYVKELSDGGANVQSCVNEQTGASGRQRKKGGEQLVTGNVKV